MTSLPPPSVKKLGLVIDLDTCVGCQACATSCKEWNTQGYSAPLTDENPYGADPSGVWLNRIHGYEVTEQGQAQSRIVHFPRSCLHCEEPACVTVCPTGASYKRAEDGIVLVNPETCIGCKLCSWACPYGAREYDQAHGVMKKCTLCVDRIYNENFAAEDRIPACVKACPTGAIQFGSKEDMKDYAAKRVEDLKERGYDQAGLYDPQGVGGTHVMYVLHHADQPNLYAGLPVNPSISPLVGLWKGFAKPLATLALAGVALGSLFHYVTKGPNEVSKEIEDEIEKEDAQ